MRISACFGCLLLLATVGAAAQPAPKSNPPSSTPDTPAAANETPRRAPLESVEAIEPAAGAGNIIQRRTADAPAPSASSADASKSPAPSTLDLGTTSITGNQELPKVLYIVPWKKADLGDLVGRPVNTLLDEVLEPVDPDVFERHLEYYETLYGSSKKE